MNFFHTHISTRARELADETLRSGWVSEGRMVRRFETEMTARLGLANPVAVNSGTSAPHLARSVAGIGRGDEVILPAQTFVATGLAVLMLGIVLRTTPPCRVIAAAPSVFRSTSGWKMT